MKSKEVMTSISEVFLVTKFFIIMIIGYGEQKTAFLF